MSAGLGQVSIDRWFCGGKAWAKLAARACVLVWPPRHVCSWSVPRMLASAPLSVIQVEGQLHGAHITQPMWMTVVCVPLRRVGRRARGPLAQQRMLTLGRSRAVRLDRCAQQRHAGERLPRAVLYNGNTCFPTACLQLLASWASSSAVIFSHSHLQ